MVCAKFPLARFSSTFASIDLLHLRRVIGCAPHLFRRREVVIITQTLIVVTDAQHELNHSVNAPHDSQICLHNHGPSTLDSREATSSILSLTITVSNLVAFHSPQLFRWFERGFSSLNDPIPPSSWISTFFSVEFLEQLCGTLSLERTFQGRHRCHHGDALTRDAINVVLVFLHPVDFGLICSSPEFEVLNLNTCAILARLVGCQISNTCPTAHRTCCNRSSSPRLLFITCNILFFFSVSREMFKGGSSESATPLTKFNPSRNEVVTAT